MVKVLTSQAMQIFTASVETDLPHPEAVRFYEGETLDERVFNMLWDIKTARENAYLRPMYCERLIRTGTPMAPK
jgi:hypothetical protein